ncbi:MAG: hypothetical protein UW16_C0031G0003 [Microgenomates group bacterium GW2011_GWC1_44_10]|nr:MAG: hypothetical protein UW16_C0031G0003 [Microgenomates group bacterium GW2011_GWC1_44_10]
MALKDSWPAEKVIDMLGRRIDLSSVQQLMGGAPVQPKKRVMPSADLTTEPPLAVKPKTKLFGKAKGDQGLTRADKRRLERGGAPRQSQGFLAPDMGTPAPAKREKKSPGGPMSFDSMDILQGNPSGPIEMFGPEKAEKPAKGGLLSRFKIGKRGGGKAKASPQIGGGKKGSKGTGVIVVVVLILAALIGVVYFLNRSGIISIPFLGGGRSESSSAQPPVPTDQQLTEMSPEEKAAWANSNLDSSITESFLNKPTSWGDFFGNWNSYLNWLLYFAAVPLVALSIFRERTQAAALVVGFLINAFMQYSAYDSGNHDFSVIAAGLYLFGLLMKWWFPTEVLLSTIGIVLMLVGLVVQVLEIKRHKNRDSAALRKSVIAAVLMLLVFSAVYVWMFKLLAAQIATFVIPADVVAQAGAALKLNVLVKGQIATSAIVGLATAYLFGVVYGMIFLPTRGRDGTVDIRNALILDSDATTLFVMFLFLFLPWIWVLPKYYLMIFG